jgi:hypothetical protein
LARLDYPRGTAHRLPVSSGCPGGAAAWIMIMFIIPHQISCGIHMKSEIPVDQAAA